MGGHDVDIDDLRHMLTPGFDPCLEEYNGQVLLRVKELDQLADGEVMMAAEVLVQLLHGAALLEYSDAEPLSIRTPNR